MPRKKEETPAAEDPTPEIQPEPASAESTPTDGIGPQGKSDDAGIADEAPVTPAAPKVWTVEDLMKEYFPRATRVSGGTLAGLHRELRRRNRKAERGY